MNRSGEQLERSNSYETGKSTAGYSGPSLSKQTSSGTLLGNGELDPVQRQFILNSVHQWSILNAAHQQSVLNQEHRNLVLNPVHRRFKTRRKHKSYQMFNSQWLLDSFSVFPFFSTYYHTALPACAVSLLRSVLYIKVNTIHYCFVSFPYLPFFTLPSFLLK